MSEFLGIDIKTLDDGGFQFCKTGLIRKVLESTGMKHSNGFPTPTKVETPLGTDANSSEAKRDWTNSYDSVIGMILYLASNTRSYISFAVHQCAWFTHNTKESNKTAVKSICQPPAPPGGTGRGAPGAPRRSPRRNMLRPRRRREKLGSRNSNSTKKRGISK